MAKKKKKNKQNKQNVVVESVQEPKEVPKTVEPIAQAKETPTIKNDKAQKILEYIAIAIIVVLVYVLGLTSAKRFITPSTTVKLTSDYTELLSDETKQSLLENTSINEEELSYYINSDTVSSLGAELPDVDLTVYGDEETINLANYKGKKVILEVIADWCTYCQQMSSQYLNDIVNANKDVVFVQYMQTGSKEQVDAFYEAIGKEHNPNITIVYQSDEMDSWLYAHNFSSYPSFYMFDEDGKNVGSVLGLTTADDFTNNYLGLFYSETALYDVKTVDGQSLSEAIKLQTVAYSYINSLTEINVPDSYINSYEE